MTNLYILQVKGKCGIEVGQNYNLPKSETLLHCNFTIFAIYYSEIIRKESFMKKVIVIGCPGGGNSAFSRRLDKLTNIPLSYLDMIFHKPDKTVYSREEFDKKIKSDYVI